MNPQKIIEIVCKEFSIDPVLIDVNTRERYICEPRHIIHYFCKMFNPNMTLSYIGKIAGNKDHATVLHSIKVVNNLQNVEKDFDARVKYLNEKIRKVHSRLLTEALRAEYVPNLTMSTYPERKQLFLTT